MRLALVWHSPVQKLSAENLTKAFCWLDLEPGMCSHNTLDTDQNKSKVQFLNVLYQIASSEILLLTFQITLHLAIIYISA